MPADVHVSLPLGADGLNLRAALADLGPGELADGLNWQLDRSGALTKRLGVHEWSVATPTAILELMLFRITAGTTYILAHCVDGNVYSTQDGSLWTLQDSGLSTDTPVGWVQYHDTLYWCDGNSPWRGWDGTTLTVDATSPQMPITTVACVWQNRLFTAKNREVRWSKATDPTDFHTYTNNFVDFPADTAITALCAVQNVVESPDGADGVLVFTENQMHRIFDGSDNTGGNVSGGANALVDNAVGCVARRSIANMQGEIFFLGRDGLYSSNGHGPARLESVPIQPLLDTMSWGQVRDFCAANWKGRYILAYAPSGAAGNTRLLEMYADLPRAGAGLTPAYARRYGWFKYMAHDIPARAFVSYDVPASGTVVYTADARPGNETYVRRLFVGGYDVSGDSTQNAITAFARTGALSLGSIKPKRLRLAAVFGRGQFAVSCSPDLSPGVGETRIFQLDSPSAHKWGDGSKWGQGLKWGSGGGGAKNQLQYYTQRGRFLTFNVTETSTKDSQFDRTLGYAGAESGGAAIYNMILKLTPLDAE